MISFFPQIYRDELLYSQITRYAARSGYAGYIYAAEDIYQHYKTVRPDIEFVNSFIDDALKWMTKEMSFESVIMNHTMFPAYVRFLPLVRRKAAFEALMRCEGNWSNLVAQPQTGQRFIRYCPLCVIDDRKNYGETYIHRAHQIQRVNVCPIHKCYLENSNVVVSGKTSPGLYAAESIFVETEPRMCDCDIELTLSEYIIEVMNHPTDLKNDGPVGMFLHSRLSKEYLNKSGIVRDITKLYEDYLRYYGDSVHTMTLTQMQKVYNGYRFDPYYVCQIALFEGISTDELCTLPKRVHITGIEEFYRKLSTKYSMDISAVKAIGEDVLKYARKQSLVQKRSGPMSKAWDKIDEETLPRVKTIVSDMLSSTERPRKITLNAVQKALQLPQKQINNLPQCLEYIQTHAETQPEYWAREVKWAIEQVEQSGQPLNWRRIRDITNMKPADLKRCSSYITEKATSKKILSILNELQNTEPRCEPLSQNDKC